MAGKAPPAPATRLSSVRYVAVFLARSATLARIASGLIPVGGILRRIASPRGLLVGDAAGAVSPLTAGGLDGALRLSSFASDVIAAYLDRGDAGILAQYTGDRFHARFIARRWMRHAIRTVSTPLIAEAALAMLRLPAMRGIAEHVFFSRGSFPDMKLELTPSGA